MKSPDKNIEELLVGLFVQARSEALKEANEIPLNRAGIVTSTPTKVDHLVKKAKAALLQVVLDCLPEKNSYELDGYADGFNEALDQFKSNLKLLMGGGRMSRFLRLIIWLFGYKITTITVARDLGFGEDMTVIYKPTPRRRSD